MLFYVNERFLLLGQPLKVLMFAPEMGAVSPGPGVVPPDLHIQFSLTDQDGRPASADFIRKVDINNFRHFRNPFSYAEVPTEGIAPGSYIVRAQNNAETIGQASVVVLDAKQYGTIAQMISAERSKGAVTRFAKSDQIVDAWFESWTELYSYLGVVIPQHVIVTRPAGTDSFEFSANMLSRLTSQSFRWVSFHINRFVFDQLFYGGVVSLRRGPDTSRFQLRLVLQYRVIPLLASESEYLALMRSMLRDTEFSIELSSLNSVPPTPGFPHQAQLDVTWRFS